MNQSRARSSNLRYETLDHWRGLACVFVVLYHSTIMFLEQQPAPPASGWPAAAGYWLIEQTHRLNVGVALFFVISGYCIAAAAESAKRRRAPVGQYFVRRFRRIYPPLWAAIVLAVGLFAALDYWPAPGLLSNPPWMQPRPTWYAPSQWFGNLTLTESWRHHLFGAPRGHFPGQAWTLCYEEQFYVVTGLLLYFARRRFYEGIALVTLATAATPWLAGMWGISISGFFFDGAWLLFAAGVAVFFRLTQAEGWKARLADAFLVIGIPFALWTGTPQDGVVGFTFALLLVQLRRFDDVLASSRWLRPLRICGQMCYSLYLVHQIPVRAVSAGLQQMGADGVFSTLFVVMPASVAVALALGWFFHLHVERRFLNQPLSETSARSQTEALEPRLALSGAASGGSSSL